MKIRNGFVSNSSSSSFIIVGTILSNSELFKRFGSDYYNNIEAAKFVIVPGFISESDSNAVGQVVTDVDDYLDDKIISNVEFSNLKQNVANSLNVPLEKISLLVGTRST